MKALTADRLRQLLHYDAATGAFTRAVRNGRFAAGSSAGGLTGRADRQHLAIYVDGATHSAAALAWLYVHGEWPAQPVRVLDDDPTNVAIANLALELPRVDIRKLGGEEAFAVASQHVSYDPAAGQFHRIGSGLLSLKPCPNGYAKLSVAGHAVLAHRLAWLLTHRRWPEGVIDHINGDPMDNRLANLRDVSMSVNSQNQRRPVKGSATGFLGVRLCKRTGKFISTIKTPDGKSHWLGHHETAQEAHAAYVAAKQRLHEGCTLVAPCEGG